MIGRVTEQKSAIETTEKAGTKDGYQIEKFNSSELPGFNCLQLEQPRCFYRNKPCELLPHYLLDR